MSATFALSGGLHVRDPALVERLFNKNDAA
jgi:hypothetical protein